MSLLKLGGIQIGQSNSASNNFHWRNPLDGMLRLTRGNADAPLVLVMRVNANNTVYFPGGYIGSADDEKRRCTAWVNFNGTGTVSIRDSYNVSSITDIGAGHYTINFATPMANANYSVVSGFGPNDGSTPNGIVIGTNGGATDVPPTVNGFTVVHYVSTGTPFDTPRLMFSVFGGKA